MATQKTNNSKKTKGSQAVVVFWLAFIIIIIGIFLINMEVIRTNFNLFKDRIANGSGTTEEELPPMEEEPAVPVTINQGPAEQPAAAPVVPAASVEPAVSTEPTASTEPAASGGTTTERPVETPQTQTPVPVQTPPVETRERVIYFTQVERDGQILQSRVTRRLPVSDSPMQDSLNAMLTGPTADEINRGILNFIPQNTRILSATIRGNTAYINFSEDFLFNTFGVEGYVAQLRQIVWTVTEFSNVQDVQFLIEGRVHNYLGEGIYIGSPISRMSF